MQYFIDNLSITPKDGTLCLFSALEDILKYYEWNVSCTDIFIMANGFEIEYESDLNFIGYYSFENKISDFAKAGLFKTHLQYKSGSPEEMFTEARRALLQNNLVLLLVGSEKLTYHEIFRSKSNENRGHTIILQGIDTENETVYIADAYFRDPSGQMIAYQGPAALKEVQDSIFGIVWFEINRGGTICKKDILKMACEYLRKFIGGKKVGGQYRGLLAWNAFINDLIHVMNADDDHITQLCININFSIKMRSIVVIIDNMADLIRNNVEFQAEGSAVLVDKLQQLAREWEKYGLNIVKIGISKKRDRIPGIIEYLKQLSNTQESVFQDYLAYLEMVMTKI